MRLVEPKIEEMKAIVLSSPKKLEESKKFV